ncbi:MAG: transglycosylase SLT domain-containing protein [Chloroherpetonaceae bacterium]|nr:transglycosylase SLT domain-containing protein [Chloroherpetonaceae bacterium]MCS7212253.1 transglycosylase SLT domain-containing protein [Chloroherpetonaceae bacterium]MDW8018828.1 transglycosylase SLT domain-containing protein [Chloroherpetonaceae bacterium]
MDSLKTISRDTLQPTRRFSATEQPSFSYAQFPRNRAVYLFGERLPFEDDEVFERFEREYIYNINDRAQMIMYFKRAGRFFPYIEARLRADSLPEDFKYLAVAESRLMDLRSPAGAAGIWQLMPSVAREYGLIVNAQIDERYNLDKATTAAIRYLKEAYKKFGNWIMVAAAYNMGMHGAQDEQAYQAEKDYFNLYLNRETARYIFRIAAIKEIMEHPERYGFADVEPYKPLETKVVEVKREIPNLALWARQQGTTLKMVKYLNPWIRNRTVPAPPPNKTFAILLPKITSPALPTDNYAYTLDAENAEQKAQGFYIVREGDTLESIANQCGLEVHEIRQLNKLRDGEPIKVGQRLRIAP